MTRKTRTMATSSSTKKNHRTAMSSVTRTTRRTAMIYTLAMNSATMKTRTMATIYRTAMSSATTKTRRTATISAMRTTRTMGTESCFGTGSAASRTATNSESRAGYSLEKIRRPGTALSALTGSGA